MVVRLDFLAEGFELSEDHLSFLNAYAYNVSNQLVWDLGSVLNPLFDRVHNSLVWCVLGTGSSEKVEIPQLGYRLFESSEFHGIKSKDFPEGLSVPLGIFYDYLLLILDESGYSASRIKYEVSSRSDWRTKGLFCLDGFKPQEVLELTKKLREGLSDRMIRAHTVVNN